MFGLSDRHHSRRAAIEDQIETLRREIAALGDEAGRTGGRMWGSARSSGAHVVSELEEAIEELIPAVRRRARQVERAARDNPTATAAAAGLVVLGLVAALVYSRR